MTRQNANVKSDFESTVASKRALHGSIFGDTLVQWEVRSWRG